MRSGRENLNATIVARSAVRMRSFRPPDQIENEVRVQRARLRAHYLTAQAQVANLRSAFMQKMLALFGRRLGRYRARQRSTEARRHARALAQ